METVHDMKDLAMIYSDCDNYKIKVWNPEEQREMNLTFCGSSKPNDNNPAGEINFVVTYKDNNDTFVFINAFRNTLKSMEKNGLDTSADWEKIFIENLLKVRNNH